MITTTRTGVRIFPDLHVVYLSATNEIKFIIAKKGGQQSDKRKNENHFKSLKRKYGKQNKRKTNETEHPVHHER